VSRRQPTLREAVVQVALVERGITNAVEVIKSVHGEHAGRFHADGFWLRRKAVRRTGQWDSVAWPVSDVRTKCDDCGCVLRDRRDAGGQGFYYDKRWLVGNPAAADPRLSNDYEPHHACLSCFNRVRPFIAHAEQINETRLMIGRIKRETRRAA